MGEATALAAVLAVYQRRGEVANDCLYAEVKESLGFTDDDYARRETIGRDTRKHCVATRAIRWYQQSLRRMNLVERVPGRRGVWRLRGALEKELTPAAAGMTLVGFSTQLGIALWSSCDVFKDITEPCALVLTSPPYALAKPRRYGNPPEREIVDFIVRSLEPIVKNLLPGGSVVVVTGNDVFVSGTPARSLYVERLVLALHEELGLALMDRLVWHQKNKAPGPMAWASGTRQQLNVAYEHCLWFTNDPIRCFADNRRVLMPHSEQHRKLMEAGGERRDLSSADGAYTLRAGRSFAQSTPGRIPRNVLEFTQHGREIAEARRAVRAFGLPLHGAVMPLGLAAFLIRFLTREGDLVVDPFGGFGTTARAAEDAGRRWLMTERIAEYVVGQAIRLRDAAGFRNSIPLDLKQGLSFA
jgi:site-specific DNA-methyltransferase (cytosine-N4-specific)